MLLAYHMLDFVVGDFARVRPAHIRSGLVLWERGWWDMAVDPARYRLRVTARLVRALGRLVPKPDLTFVLEAPPEVLLERKAELSSQEMVRQAIAWREVLPPRVERVFLDARKPAKLVAAEAREALLELLEERAIARLGRGWVGLPRQESERWLVPRGPRRATIQALEMNRPTARPESLLWAATLVLARVGGTRLLPRSRGIPATVRAAVAKHLQRGDSLTVAQRDGTHYAVVQIVSADGRCRLVAKVATDEQGIDALAREVEAIERVGDRVSPPITVPRVLEAVNGCTVFEGFRPIPRSDPWYLPPDVAHSLGRLSVAGKTGRGSVVSGISHGDFAPSNLLTTADRWLLVNWEAAETDRQPFSDLFHYLVEAHSVHGRPSTAEIREGLSGRGWVGAAMEAYARGAGLPIGEVKELLLAYLGDTRKRSQPTTTFAVRRVNARETLLSGLRA
jgi:hypothetical protein